MKIRISFVSNSSSSSFVIKKKHLTKRQIKKIKNHMEEVKKEKYKIYDFYDDPWSIEETKKHIFGFTWMDNFNMDKFLELIGIKEKYIIWEHD